MKLTTQEEYGLRCLLQIGRRGEGGSLTIAEMGHLEGISAPNVAKIMRILRRAGLVNSTRGKAGGYTLARPAAATPVGDVLGALGGRLLHARLCDPQFRLQPRLPDDSDCS